METTVKQDEAMYKLSRSWRGCDAVIVGESVTLVPIADRAEGMYSGQIMPEEMPLSEAHKKCEQLNKIQIAGGYLDWLWSPVPAEATLVDLADLIEFDNIVKNY